jgi:hypothetical protein
VAAALLIARPKPLEAPVTNQTRGWNPGSCSLIVQLLPKETHVGIAVPGRVVHKKRDARDPVPQLGVSCRSKPTSIMETSAGRTGRRQIVYDIC